MAGFPPSVPGRIFISYRHEDAAYPAGWLFAQLTDHLGPGQVFKDVDSIEFGDDFVEVITRAVGSCNVLLALIGEEWLTITDAQGRRRLDDPDDYVRLEIETALARDIRVIPVLVDGARMPRADQLPDSLVRLVRRQALELSATRFNFDTGRLLKVLDRTLAEMRATREDAASMPAPAAGPRATELAEGSPTPSIPLAAPKPTYAREVLFDVVLTDAGERKAQVTKVVREYTGLGLIEGKDLVDAAERAETRITSLPRDEADEMLERLQEAGAQARLRCLPGTSPS